MGHGGHGEPLRPSPLAMAGELPMIGLEICNDHPLPTDRLCMAQPLHLAQPGRAPN